MGVVVDSNLLAVCGTESRVYMLQGLVSNAQYIYIIKGRLQATEVCYSGNIDAFLLTSVVIYGIIDMLKAKYVSNFKH